MNSGRTRPAILVTGIHRSGTTFLGKMLSIPHEVGYVHEPFNQTNGLQVFDRWFIYLKEGLPSESVYASAIADLLSGHGVYKLAPERAGAPLRTILRPILRSKENVQYILSKWNPMVTRYLIKDPFASFSCEYLLQRFPIDVIVIVRHPAAFVCSLQRMNWRFEFSNLLDQPALLEDHIGHFLQDCNPDTLPPLEQAALLWKCVYSTLSTYIRRNPQIIMIRHEDMSINPEQNFENIYDRLGITYTNRCRRIIRDHTKSSNPTAPINGRIHMLKRDSRSNVKHWKKILSRDEIHKIKLITQDVARFYYSEDDW